MGNAERDKAKIGLRWPLASARISSEKPVSKEIQTLIAKQLNVKEIILEKGENIEVKLDLVQTLELESEGYMRELARKIQAERKKAGYTKTDLVNMEIFTDVGTEKMLLPFLPQLKERVNAKKIIFSRETHTSDKSLLDCSVKQRRIFVIFS